MPQLPGLAGVRIGHASDRQAATGCTVILCPAGCTAAVDVRGGAPGTRETDVLRPGNLVGRVHAVLLTGGSAFGLAAATGVMRYLEQRGAGFPTPAGPVPIVAAAVLYDLDVGDGRVRPDEAMGWQACLDAERDGPLQEGSVGAGTGATVGKLFGAAYRMKGGLGVATAELSSGFRLAAVAAVNAAGDVVEPDRGLWVAGAWNPTARRPLGPRRPPWEAGETPGPTEAGKPGQAAQPLAPPGPGQSTTLACVVTDLPLDGADLARVAAMAHDGLARVLRPAHTLWDGDTVFALSCGSGPLYAGRPRALAVSEAGAAAAYAVAEAVVRAVRLAESLAGVPARRHLEQQGWLGALGCAGVG